jgi:two-component system, NarL family, response regulator NreC
MNLVRQGLRLLLEAEGDFHVIAEAADGLVAIDLAKSLQPNVLVVDIMMPGVNGLEVTRQVEQQVPVTRVVLLSMYSDESYIVHALRCGAAAYVLKGARKDCLLSGIRAVIAGRRYLSPPLSEQAIKAYLKKGSAAGLDLYECLTRREREVLQLVAHGCTNTETAARLFISPRTVETHRANMMRRLSLRTRSDLIRYALRHGLLSLTD